MSSLSARFFPNFGKRLLKFESEINFNFVRAVSVCLASLYKSMFIQSALNLRGNLYVTEIFIEFMTAIHDSVH